MPACSSCNYDNVIGANFCSSCGTPLVQKSVVDDVTASYDALAVDEEEVPEVTDLPEGSSGALVVYQGPKKGTRIALGDDEITIGRDPDSDVFLDDVTVSRRHAKISKIGTDYEVSDLGSMNGTYVNKTIADTVLLQDRDELQIGKFKLVYFSLDSEEVES